MRRQRRESRDQPLVRLHEPGARVNRHEIILALEVREHQVDFWRMMAAFAFLSGIAVGALVVMYIGITERL